MNVRAERSDFNLADIRIATRATQLETVVVYTEKPLIESKEGNITVNASESALTEFRKSSLIRNSLLR